MGLSRRDGREAFPGGYRPETHEKSPPKFRISDGIRDARQYALEFVHIDGLSIETAQIKVTADNGEGVPDLLRSDGLCQGLFCFCREGE
jgi:hypothetical protein